jgi:nucleotide-binding universal stress UspA family protein
MDQFAPTSILCPIDFSESTPRVLEVASSIAGRYGASLHVVHVWRLPTVGVLDGVSTIPDAGEIELLTTSLKEELARAADGIAALPRERIRTHLVQGDAAPQIIEVATKTACDLIVLGTHGRTGLSHLVMGSVAEQVVHRTRVPVLVVPTPKR